MDDFIIFEILYKKLRIGQMLKRDTTIDILKGIGIILMVCGHAYAPFTHFIYLFHMAIFFIASGYCYKDKNSENVYEIKKFVFRKLKGLWFPYVVWMIIFTLCHNLFIDLNIYTSNPLLLKYSAISHVISPLGKNDIIKNIIKAILLHGSSQMASAFWFLATLMELSIFYCLADFVIKKVTKSGWHGYMQGSISIIFLLIGYYMSIKNVELLGINRVFSYYILFFLGIVLKKYVNYDEIENRYKIISFGLSLIILLVGNKLGTIALNENQYVNPLYLIIMSLSGWILIYEISSSLKKNKQISKIFICIGKHTLAVVVLHFLFFKIVNFLGVLISGYSYVAIAAFPVLYTNSYWWVLYSLIGVIVPVILSLLWEQIKKFF